MQDLEACVFRVLNQSSETIGTGFLVPTSDGCVGVTCAHVAAQAGARPNTFLNLCFEGGLPVLAYVLADGWSPPEEDDCAFLRISSLPAGAIPARLCAVRDSTGHQALCRGYPAGIADRSEDTLLGLVRLESGFQRLRMQSHLLAPGFSGGPVLDLELDRVVGMVSFGTDKNHARAVQAIPCETLAGRFAALHLDAPAPSRGEAQGVINTGGGPVLMGNAQIGNYVQGDQAIHLGDHRSVIVQAPMINSSIVTGDRNQVIMLPGVGDMPSLAEFLRLLNEMRDLVHTQAQVGALDEESAAEALDDLERAAQQARSESPTAPSS